MSGSAKKQLIACAAAVVLLGGGVAAMKFTEPKPELDTMDPADVSEEASGSMIYSGPEKDLKTVYVTNANGGFIFTRTYKGSGDEDDANKYKIEGLENVKLDSYTTDNLASNAAALESKAVIEENASDLGKYGLSEPRAEAVITFDGDEPQTVTVLVGNDTPGGDIYVKLADSSTVYSASSSFLKCYTYEKEYFVSHLLVEEPSEDEYPVISSVRVHRSDLEQDIVFEYDPYSDGENEQGGTSAAHVMTSPVHAYLNVSDSVKYTHGIFGLRAKNVLSVEPSEQELEFAGILDPVCTVTMTLEDGQEYVLKLGVSYGEDGGYTGYLEGTDVLWQFDPNSVPWMTMAAEDAMSTLVFGSYVYDVTSVSLTEAGNTSEFTCTGDSADNYKVQFSGEEYDRNRFLEFYQALIKAPAEEICLEDDGTELLVSVKITRRNGLPDENVEFWKTEGNKVLIKKDGDPCFKCRASFVNKALIPNISKIQGTDDFVTNW